MHMQWRGPKNELANNSYGIVPFDAVAFCSVAFCWDNNSVYHAALTVNFRNFIFSGETRPIQLVDTGWSKVIPTLSPSSDCIGHGNLSEFVRPFRTTVEPLITHISCDTHCHNP